ncbi:MAG TPA: zf-HC2 domain-containing protein [Caulobacteraceae bacterium]
MPCAETLHTQAFIDGELTGREAEIAEAHIAGCADCQAFCAAAAALSDGIRRHAPRYAAPDRLKARLDRALAKAEGRPTRTRASPGARGAFWRGAVGGALGGVGLGGLAAALAVLAVMPPSPASLADRVVGAHTRALISGKVIEVASNDHHTVKPWFAGRIDLSPPVADFAQQGFKLTGGRLDKAANAPAAVVVYRHGLHEIDLFVWSDHGGRLPGSATRLGYHAIFWKKGDLDFAAVSDMEPGELATFSNLVRGQAE